MSVSATPTFFWHDYETFGADPKRDRPAQFAGVRTDTELNIIEEPVMFYCKPADDFLPNPQACLITGITPQQALVVGVCEAEFIARIHAEMARPGTCGVGYNSIRFDDEVTRYTLYRNFYDPYAREWQNDCSRWDIIDMLRLTRALRPEGIQWPSYEDGTPSLRLEDAKELARREEIDAAFLDVNLGRGDTSQPVVEILRERGIPYAFVTAYDANQITFRLSDDRVLRKPVTSEGMLKTLRSVLPHLEKRDEDAAD